MSSGSRSILASCPREGQVIRLVEEGVYSPAEIDTACKLGLGHPIELRLSSWTTRRTRSLLAF